MPVGRPKKDDARRVSLTLRITEDESKRLLDNAEALNISRTDVLMKGVTALSTIHKITNHRDDMLKCVLKNYEEVCKQNNCMEDYNATVLLLQQMEEDFCAENGIDTDYVDYSKEPQDLLESIFVEKYIQKLAKGQV